MFTKTRTLFVGTLVLAEASAFALEPVENRLGGHAARAKELLQQASEEIKLAAIAANQR